MKTITHYDEPFLIELETEVLSCKKDKDEYLVALKETLFFVESGGQPKDEGWIDGHEVIDVYIYDGTIYHVLKEPVEGKVKIKIDWPTRFAHMQAHSSQHLAGAIVIYEMGIPVLSNHYNQNGTCDIDIDTSSFTKEQCMALEKRCNEAISEDIPLTISYVDEETARKYCETDFEDYKGFETYRVVTIEGIEHDLCGCIHVPSTRWLKAIHILSATKISKGIKLTIDCGEHLIASSHHYYDELTTISTSLGVPFEEIMDAIEHMREQYKEATKLLDHYRKAYLDFLVQEKMKTRVDDQINLWVVDDPLLSLEDMKYLIVNYTKESKVVCVGMKEEDGKLSLVISRSKDVNQFNSGAVFKKIREYGSIRGGGSPIVAQGGGDVFDNYKELILNLVKEQLDQ